MAEGGRTHEAFGDGGPNLVSSFHVIGEIFDRVYPEASLVVSGAERPDPFRAPGPEIAARHSGH